MLDAMPTVTLPPLPVLSDELFACCTPTGTSGLDAERAQRLAAVLKVIAEPTRLRLLSLVAGHADGEACICDLTEPVALSQPTVSHHMKMVVEAGLLEREQRGKWAYYRLVPGALDMLAGLVGTIARPAESAALSSG
jgi:ArsR family transcriptional regulator, arsenate/arsenite/antimonite-responsive transcriptional repressor